MNNRFDIKFHVSSRIKRKSRTILAFVWLCLKSFLYSEQSFIPFSLQNAILNVQKLKSKKHALNTNSAERFTSVSFLLLKIFLLIPLLQHFNDFQGEWKEPVWFKFMLHVPFSRRVSYSPTRVFDFFCLRLFLLYHKWLSSKC